MRSNHRSVNGWKSRGIAIATLALFSSSSLMLGTALAAHPSGSTVPAGFIDAADLAYDGVFNPLDARVKLQLAINTGLNVFVPNMGTPWITDTLLLDDDNDNQTIRFEEGVVLEAIVGGLPGTNDPLILVLGADNVRLEGYGATFRLLKDDYLIPADYIAGEWRHGIRMS